MFRRLLLGSVVVAVAAMTALPVASAATPTPGPKGNKPTPPVAGERRHGYFGTIQSVGDSTFVLELKKGEEINVLVTPDTRIHIPGLKPAGLENLETGDRAAVNGTPGKDGVTAKSVAVAPGKPITVHHVGTVTAVSATEITIRDKKDNMFTFKLTSETVIKGEGETVQVAVGDLVTVVARRVPAMSYYTATAIVVHPTK